MALITYRRYEVKPENLIENGKPSNMQVNIPIAFLRDHTKVGDQIVLSYDGDNKRRMVVTIEKGSGIQAE